MRRRELLLASLALLAVPWRAAAAAQPAVTMVLKSLKNPFFELMTAGARKHYAQHRAEYRLTLDGVPEESDVAGQVKIIETSIARRDQILIITPADSRAIIPALIKAIQSGMLVINLDNKLDDRALAGHGVNIPFVGPSNFNGARAVGRLCAARAETAQQGGRDRGPARLHQRQGAQRRLPRGDRQRRHEPGRHRLGRLGAGQGPRRRHGAAAANAGP